MMPPLALFQDRLAQALYATETDSAPEFAGLQNQPGFAVYRNTVMKGAIDALQANYPAVTRLVGEEWLRSAAAIYVCMHPPKDARLLYYGDSFPDFLARFEPADGLPYLPEVARLDRCWSEAHVARDESPLEPAVLSSLVPEALGNAVLRPHASARWQWFPEQPAYTIWQWNRTALDTAPQITWQGEGALLVRPGDTVIWMPLDAAGCAFLDACKDELPLSDAANAALAVSPEIDLAHLLSTLFGVGAFSGVDGIDDTGNHSSTKDFS